MGFTRSIRPRALVGGQVVNTQILTKKGDGAVYGFDIVIRGLNDAFFAVKVFQGNGDGQMTQADLPNHGEFVVYEVELVDASDRGPASITYAGPAYSLLDAFTASQAVPAKG